MMWVCPKCNTYNDEKTAICIECCTSRFNKKYKRAIELEAALTRHSYAGSHGTSKLDSMKKTGNDKQRSTPKTFDTPRYCGNCGCHIAEEARFCPECGAKL